MRLRASMERGYFVVRRYLDVRQHAILKPEIFIRYEKVVSNGRREIHGTYLPPSAHRARAFSSRSFTLPRRVLIIPSFCIWEQIRATWIREAFTAEARFS